MVLLASTDVEQSKKSGTYHRKIFMEAPSIAAQSCKPGLVHWIKQKSTMADKKKFVLRGKTRVKENDNGGPNADHSEDWQPI